MLPFFVEFWKLKYFFYIHTYPPPIAVQNSLTNKFCQKKLCFCTYSKKRKKVTSFSGTLLNISFLHFFVVENIQKHQFLAKFIGQWFPDGDGRGIARDINLFFLFFFFKFDKKWPQSLDNFKSWNVVKGPNFVNCSNFVTPPIAVQNSLPNQFDQKNLCINAKPWKHLKSLADFGDKTSSSGKFLRPHFQNSFLL